MLALGQNTTFNTLYELQQCVASVVLNQPHPPNVAWNAGFSKVSCADAVLDMTDFRPGIQSMLKDTDKLFSSLTGGTKFADKLPENFIDDLPNDTRGYSFMSHGPFVQEPHAFLSYLVDRSPWKICSFDANNCACWNIPAVHEILSLCADINRHLSVLCFLLPTMATRITQFIDTKLQNLDRPRNIHLLIEDMFHLMRYHKMTNLTGLDKCIPAFYPQCLKDFMLEYLLGGIQEVVYIFTKLIYGKEAAAQQAK